MRAPEETPARQYTAREGRYSPQAHLETLPCAALRRLSTPVAFSEPRDSGNARPGPRVDQAPSTASSTSKSPSRRAEAPLTVYTDPNAAFPGPKLAIRRGRLFVDFIGVFDENRRAAAATPGLGAGIVGHGGVEIPAQSVQDRVRWGRFCRRMQHVVGTRFDGPRANVAEMAGKGADEVARPAEVVFHAIVRMVVGVDAKIVDEEARVADVESRARGAHPSFLHRVRRGRSAGCVGAPCRRRRAAVDGRRRRVARIAREKKTDENGEESDGNDGERQLAAGARTRGREDTPQASVRTT